MKQPEFLLSKNLTWEKPNDLRNAEDGQRAVTFFVEELPHSDRDLCSSFVKMEKSGVISPQCQPAALNSVMEANKNLLIKMPIQCFTAAQAYYQTLLVKNAINVTSNMDSDVEILLDLRSFTVSCLFILGSY